MAKAKGSKRSKTGPRTAVKYTELTVQDFTWGSTYIGTKESLIVAGLALPEHFPRGGSGEGPQYDYPWDAMPDQFGMTRDAQVQHDDSGLFAVWVKHRTEEMVMRHKVAAATTRLSEIYAEILEMVRGLPPRPVSDILGIPARRLEESKT